MALFLKLALVFMAGCVSGMLLMGALVAANRGEEVLKCEEEL